MRISGVGPFMYMASTVFLDTADALILKIGIGTASRSADTESGLSETPLM
jgi:hypothetical protein